MTSARCRTWILAAGGLILILLWIAAIVPHPYECEACNGTGWNQGLRSSDDPDIKKCTFCGGTLRISWWSRTLGDHAHFMKKVGKIP